MDSRPTYFLWLAFVASFLSGCRTSIPPQIVPTVVRPNVALSTNSAILADCNAESQALAIRPDQVPDWDALDLNACYNLSLDLDPETVSYTGHLSLTLANDTGPAIQELVFRIYPNASVIYGGHLEVDRTLVDGVKVLPEIFLRDQTGLRLELPSPLAIGETVKVEMDFSGEIPTDFGNLPRTYGVFNYATEAQVITLANWYPILAGRENGTWQEQEVLPDGDAVVSESALYQVQVTAPEEWQVVSTGFGQNKVHQAGQTRWNFVSGPVREFTVLASPHFVERTADKNGIQVHHWGLPSGESRWGEALQVTVDSLTVYEDRFGPYPYAELDVVAAPMKNASGIEYPGLFILRDTLYDPNSQQPHLLDIVAAHETAHQWWYGLVGSDVLKHPWQDEGLTTFSSLLYLERYQPQVYEGTLQVYKNQVEGIEDRMENDSFTRPVSAYQDKPGAYGTLVYQKGALFFLALKEHIGDNDFFAALQAYYAEHRYQLAQPEDLLSAFEASCKCDLETFYAVWDVQ